MTVQVPSGFWTACAVCVVVTTVVCGCGCGCGCVCVCGCGCGCGCGSCAKAAGARPSARAPAAARLSKRLLIRLSLLCSLVKHSSSIVNVRLFCVEPMKSGNVRAAGGKSMRGKNLNTRGLISRVHRAARYDTNLCTTVH